MAQGAFAAGTRPLVISHAGCAGKTPENTLAGIRAALELQVDAIEVDVRASADGIPVLMHDATLDRTTNGRGLVAGATLAELRALDAGGEPVPTLSEALALCRGRARLVIEIKQSGIEPQVAGAVRDAAAQGEVEVWSFIPQVLTAMRDLMPDIPSALLVSEEGCRSWPSFLEVAGGVRAQAVSAFHAALTEEMVEEAKALGLAVYAWTADSEPDIQRLARLGLRGIVSNHPDRVATVLARA